MYNRVVNIFTARFFGVFELTTPIKCTTFFVDYLHIIFALPIVIG